MRETKQKRFFYLEIAFYMLFLYGISACIFLNGDDFMYGSFSKDKILQSVASYYVTGNGRFWINILDTLLLSFDRYLFIIVAPVIIMLFIMLLAKNIQWIVGGQTDVRQERKYFRYAMLLFACMDVLCLRETVFWITGMMNYLFPATVFLFAFLCFQQVHSNACRTPIQGIFYCIICLLAASSVEQFALIFVGMETLLLGVDLLHKKSIPKLLLSGYLSSLLGLAILLLAPGNFVRVGAQNALMPPFIDNAWTLIYQNTMSTVAFPFLLMLSLCGSSIICKEARSKLTRIFSMLVPVFMAGGAFFNFWERAILIVGLLLLFGVQMFFLFIYRRYLGKTVILSLVFVGLGSQIMLLISAIWGFRCMFSMYMVYMLLIMFCLPELETDMRLLVLCSGIVASLSAVALVIFWCLWLLLKNRAGALHIGGVILSRVAVVSALVILFVGYAGNAATHIANLSRTSQVSSQNELVLQELPDDLYSWYFIPMGEFHESYYRLYHCIPDSVVIKYTANDAVQ